MHRHVTVSGEGRYPPVIASERVRSFDEPPTRETAARVVREVVSVVSRAALVLVFSLPAMGCSSLPFFKKSPPPVTQREPPKTQTAPAGGSASDTLRDDTARRSPVQPAPEPARRAPAQPAPEPPRTVQPTPAQEAPQPQPAAAPAELAPAQNSPDPDARAVIDWLLKDRR